MDCQANFSEVFQQSIKFSLKCTIYTFKYQKAPTEGVGNPPPLLQPPPSRPAAARIGDALSAYSCKISFYLCLNL